MPRCPKCQRPLILKQLSEGPVAYLCCVCEKTMPEEHTPKAPFDLPIIIDDKLFMLSIGGKRTAALIMGDVDDWNDKARLAYLKYIALACNSYAQDQKTIKVLLDAITNARTTIAIMSMPRPDDSVATNEALLQIMDESFESALAKKGKTHAE